MIMNLNVFILRLEIENARLEATANKQSKEINTLQKGTHEAALVSLLFQSKCTECFHFNGSRSHLHSPLNCDHFDESCNVIVKTMAFEISARKHSFFLS